MEKPSSILIKRDASQDAAIVIATYENIGGFMKYTTYKNDKAIAWSSSIEGAMDNHDMYVRIQILKEVDQNIDVPKYHSRISHKKSNNRFLFGLN